jgi:HSP20 family molecular chaperone IbpA
VDPDRITADFQDGLLRLTVPKAQARTTRVKVERAE